ncbi:hypothetical protein AB0I10_31040 [Streptomyces sp. NPDC050636]|uniref:hypothetical protein n=1 Tax=Streptomyces sp. NPDC050636 TaxID=3154510 RepID=UPI00343EAC5F
MRIRSTLAAVALAAVAVLTTAGTAAADGGDDEFVGTITQTADSNVGPDPSQERAGNNGEERDGNKGSLDGGSLFGSSGMS